MPTVASAKVGKALYRLKNQRVLAVFFQDKNEIVIFFILNLYNISFIFKFFLNINIIIFFGLRAWLKGFSAETLRKNFIILRRGRPSASR